MIEGVVLAAGMSRRMGRNKLLLPLGGRPLLAHALSAMAGSEVDEVLCILGYEAERVMAALAKEDLPRDVRWVVNDAFETGRASSIRTALSCVPQGCEGVVFLPGDVLGVTAEDVDAVVRAFHRTDASIVVATREDGSRSHPLLFRRELFPRLLALEGDTGGQSILDELWESAAKVSRPSTHVEDLDTEEDYTRALALEAWCAPEVKP